MFELDTTIIN